MGSKVAQYARTVARAGTSRYLVINDFRSIVAESQLGLDGEDWEIRWRRARSFDVSPLR